MASYREQQYYQEIPPEIQEAGFNFGTTISPPLINTSTTSEAPFRPLERCNSCGTLKRQSTSSLSYLQEPSSKRVSLLPSATATGNTSSGGNHHFVSQGFQEPPVANCTSSPVPPPLSSSNVKQNVLDRSISDITSYMGTQEIGEFKANGLESPENSKINVASASPSPAAGSYPPFSQTLERSLSDPTGSDFQAVATTTPPRPPAARTFSRSPSYGQESTNSKRLRRIKERMKEMSQWMDDFVPEEDKDEQTCTGSDDAIGKNSKDLSQNDSQNEHEEAVWAERNGEGLVLHFKCPCGKGYEIFLSGKKCYYRLI